MRVAAEARHAGRSPEASPETRGEKGRHAPTRQGRVAAWFLQLTAGDGARMETVNPEVAGSSPVEPAIFPNSYVRTISVAPCTLPRTLPTRMGTELGERFSDRLGITTPRTVAQVRSMDTPLLN